MKARMSINFSNRVAIVTGAGTGIGEAVAHALARLGANVMCAGLPGDPVADVAKSLKKYKIKASYFEGDLGESEIADKLIQQTIAEFGQLDVLISNAGVTLAADSTEKLSDEAFERTMKNNVFSTFYVTRASLPYLKKTRGCIVATGSVAGLKGEPGDTIYGGSKGFVHLFMQSLAVEQAKHGIRVNVIG